MSLYEWFKKSGWFDDYGLVNLSLTNLPPYSSQHSCSIAMPFRKDPYYRGEIKFLDNNGSNLNVGEFFILLDHKSTK